MSTYQSIFKSSSENEQKFYDIAEIIQKKERDNGLTGLDMNERKFYLLDMIVSELNNGGFDQFFFNTENKYNNEILSVLTELELPFLSQLLQKGINIYNSTEDEDERMDLLEELDGKFYDELDYKEFFTKVLGVLK
ncbi:DUF4375 domain-containing protein [Cytobacillus suaedae]|nr:DUF4375 domain-containing protein [Cytobacillus suaedae]